MLPAIVLRVGWIRAIFRLGDIGDVCSLKTGGLFLLTKAMFHDIPDTITNRNGLEVTLIFHYCHRVFIADYIRVWQLQQIFFVFNGRYVYGRQHSVRAWDQDPSQLVFNWKWIYTTRRRWLWKNAYTTLPCLHATKDVQLVRQNLINERLECEYEYRKGSWHCNGYCGRGRIS